MSKSKHPEAKNQTDAPIFRRARLIKPSDAAVSPARPAVSPACFPIRYRVAAAPSGVSQQRLSAAGEGAFTVTPADPQPQNSEKRRIPQRKITHPIKTIAYTKTKSAPLTRFPPQPRPENPAKHPQTGPRNTYPQTRAPYPQTRTPESRQTRQTHPSSGQKYPARPRPKTKGAEPKTERDGKNVALQYQRRLVRPAPPALCAPPGSTPAPGARRSRCRPRE